MLLGTKIEQKTKKRISTAALHYSLLECTATIKNIESHCINNMLQMIVIWCNNINIRYIWSENLHVQVEQANKKLHFSPEKVNSMRDM